MIPEIQNKLLEGLPDIVPDYLKEKHFKDRVAAETRQIFDNFSKEEQLRIAFEPCILMQIAWDYTDRVLAAAAQQRITLLTKLSRTVKKLRQQHEETLRQDLDFAHIQHIRQQTQRFINEYARDFAILYFTVNAEFKRQMPDYPYDEMRTNAIIAMLFIRQLIRHNLRMDHLVQSRIGGNSKSSVPQPIAALYRCLDAFAGKIDTFRFSEKNIALAMKVIDANMQRIQFTIV